MSDPKRPRGRPPLDPNDPSISYSVRIPRKDLDTAVARAVAERITTPEWIRRMMRRAVAEHDPE